MGMYTELIFGAELKKDTPEDVINTLRNMCGDENFQDNLNLGRNSFYAYSFYFAVSNSKPFMEKSTAGHWIISTRGNIKNYGGEIESFLEWIKPYIESGSGIRDFYAIVTQEEQSIPTIYYLTD